ncbi:methyltransferase family protein [Humitalea sp. 24SJ18S-53]|uniref:methyltransferase family protein n=1 Tax=Humitalea sp. 24SJ18S-53 TaxID=3422307 RepID=UPI003D67FE8B
MQWLELKIPPPVLFLAGVALVWLLDVPWLAFSSQFSQPIALGLGALGIGIDIVAIRQFRAVATTINPMAPGKASVLVDSGVFSVSRNPMYLGQAVILFALALFLGHGAAVIVAPLHVWFLTRVQILPEERALLARFGAPYAAYMARVPRWL